VGKTNLGKRGIQKTVKCRSLSFFSVTFVQAPEGQASGYFKDRGWLSSFYQTRSEGKEGNIAGNSRKKEKDFTWGEGEQQKYFKPVFIRKGTCGLSVKSYTRTG